MQAHASEKSINDEKTDIKLSYISKESLKTVLKTGTYRVSRILDDLTLMLDNGQIVRLTGLDLPGRFKDETPEHVIESYHILKELFLNQPITLYQTQNAKKGRTNRMDHQLGHVVRSKDKVWAQGTLLINGLARMRISEHNPELSRDMAQNEQKAISSQKGLWSKESYDLKTPDSTENHVSSFQVVEGVVQSVAAIKNNIYLNFGQNWKTDFTISIPLKLRRDFLSHDIDPLKLQGKKIQARGWIQSYNGPYIKLSHVNHFIIIPEHDDNDMSAFSENKKSKMIKQNSLQQDTIKHLKLVPMAKKE